MYVKRNVVHSSNFALRSAKRRLAQGEDFYQIAYFNQWHDLVLRLRSGACDPRPAEAVAGWPRRATCVRARPPKNHDPPTMHGIRRSETPAIQNRFGVFRP